MTRGRPRASGAREKRASAQSSRDPATHERTDLVAANSYDEP